jgi:hypothetical protein
MAEIERQASGVPFVKATRDFLTLQLLEDNNFRWIYL